MRIRFAAVILTTLLVALGLYAGAQVPLQSPRVPLQAPDIVFGADIGFRVERTLPNRAIGTLMVRVDGKWVEAWVAGRGGVVPLQVK